MKNDFPLENIKTNFHEKLAELDGLLEDIEEERRSYFIRELKNTLDFLFFIFGIINTSRSPIENKDYFSRSHLINEITKANKNLVKLLEFEVEYEFYLMGSFAKAYKESIQKDHEFGDENISFPNHRYLLVNSLSMEDKNLENLLKIVERGDYMKHPKTRDCYKHIFIIIGIIMNGILNVIPTSTFHKDLNSYGLFAQIIMWVFDIFEKELPPGMENLLKETVKELDDWDFKELVDYRNNWEYWYQK